MSEGNRGHDKDRDVVRSEPDEDRGVSKGNRNRPHEKVSTDEDAGQQQDHEMTTEIRTR